MTAFSLSPFVRILPFYFPKHTPRLLSCRLLLSPQCQLSSLCEFYTADFDCGKHKREFRKTSKGAQRLRLGERTLTISRSSRISAYLCSIRSPVPVALQSLKRAIPLRRKASLRSQDVRQFVYFCSTLPTATSTSKSHTEPSPKEARTTIIVSPFPFFPILFIFNFLKEVGKKGKGEKRKNIII